MSTFFLNVNDKNRPNVVANCVAEISKLSAAKPWEVIVQPYRKEKSDEQNRALWGLAYKVLRDATGEDSLDVLHEYMCGEYFGWIETVVFGRKKLKPARTTTTGYDGKSDKLKADEFALFFDFIQRRATQNGINIPDPDPFWRQRIAEQATALPNQVREEYALMVVGSGP